MFAPFFSFEEDVDAGGCVGGYSMRLLVEQLPLGSCFERDECVDELDELVFGLGDRDADVGGGGEIVIAKDIGCCVGDRGGRE